MWTQDRDQCTLFADMWELDASSARGRASHTETATDTQNVHCDASSAPIAPAPHLEGEPYAFTSAPTDTDVYISRTTCCDICF